MNQKFTVQQYEICVNFKTDNALVMSAEFLPTGQLFLSPTVQLMRIKRDTIIATLDKKSQKNLRCQLEQVVTKDQKQLIIKFIVNFDFLPQFSEEIHLEYVQKKESIKSMQVNNFKADIQKLQGMLDAFNKNGIWNYYQIPSVSSTSDKLAEIKRLEVLRNKYLLRLSGVFTDPSGISGVNNHLTFLITVPGQAEPIKRSISVHSLSGYSYPFFFEQVIECNQGEVAMQYKTSGTQGSISNTYLTLCPI